MEGICITWLPTALINNTFYFMLQKLLRTLDKGVLIKFQHNVSNGKSKNSFNPFSSNGNGRFKSQVLAAGFGFEYTGYI